MHVTTTSLSTLTIFTLGVNALALPQSNGLTVGAPAPKGGEPCDLSGQKVCNAAGTGVFTCLKAPGTAGFFAGTQSCIAGFQVCVDGVCVVDPKIAEKPEEPLTGEGGEGLTIGNGNTAE